MKLFPSLAALALLAAAGGLHAVPPPSPSPTPPTTPVPTLCETVGPLPAQVLASGGYAAANPLTYNAMPMGMPSGTENIIFLRISSSGALPTGVSYAGQPLNLIRSDPTFDGGVLASYYLQAPANGINNLEVDYAAGGGTWFVTAANYFNVDPVTPIGNTSSSTGNASSFSDSVVATEPGNLLLDFLTFGASVAITTSAQQEAYSSACCDFPHGTFDGGSHVSPGLHSVSYTLSATTNYTEQLVEIRGLSCPGGSATATPPPATASNQLQVFPNLLRGPGAGAQVQLFSPGGGNLQVRVIRPSGRGLRNLWTGRLGPGGSQVLTWDGRDDAGQDAGSGVYYVVFIDGNGSKVLKKVLVIR